MANTAPILNTALRYHTSNGHDAKIITCDSAIFKIPHTAPYYNRNARIALMTSSAATFNILAIVQTEKPSCFKVEISFRVSRRIIILLVPVQKCID
jgi:hypothetical protein